MKTGTTVLVVIGGVIAALSWPGVAANILEQRPNTWVKRSPLADTPPSPRLGYEGACAWDNRHKVLIRYGGHNQGGGGAQYSEVWTFEPVSARWTLKEPDISPPGVCCAQQNLFDPVRGRYIRFPAFSGNHGWQWFREIYLNNSTIWVYDLDENTWRELRPIPAPRVTGLRCASWDSDAQAAVVFGGEGNREGTVVYDPHTNTWTSMKPPFEPPFRSGGNMVHDQAAGLHIMFGSQFGDDPRTWAYDLKKNHWRNLKPRGQPPAEKNDAILAYDSLNRVVIALVKVSTAEGENVTHRLETWAYDSAENAWTKMNPPVEPDPTGNRSRVLSWAPELGLTILENRTRSEPGPPEQQIWTYCYDRPQGAEHVEPPQQMQLTTETSAAVLRWKPSISANVTRYIVYRGTGERPWEVDYAPIASLDAGHTSYRDTGLKRNTVYYYAVRAAAGELLSEPSVKVRTQPAIIEQAVVSVLSENKVEVSWARPEATDIVGYNVERAAVEVWTEDQLRRLKSKVKPLPEPSVGAIRRIGQFARVNEAPLEGTVFVDGIDLTRPLGAGEAPVFESRLHDEHLDRGGKGYRFAVFAYRVRALNALGVESGPSPYLLTIPSAPRWVFAKEEGTSCRLKWAANPEKRLKGYRIYRLDGRWDKDTISRLTDEPIDALGYRDVTAGRSIRRYHIVAVDALGQEGLPSAPVWYNREWKRYYEPFTGPWHQ